MGMVEAKLASFLDERKSGWALEVQAGKKKESKEHRFEPVK